MSRDISPHRGQLHIAMATIHPNVYSHRVHWTACINAIFELYTQGMMNKHLIDSLSLLLGLFALLYGHASPSTFGHSVTARLRIQVKFVRTVVSARSLCLGGLTITPCSLRLYDNDQTCQAVVLAAAEAVEIHSCA